MGIQINGTNDTISAADGSLNINGSRLDTIGINGASPQTPIDVISNSSGNGITVRGRSADGLGNIRFTSNNYATLYGGFKHDASALTIFNELSGSLKLGTNGTDRVTIDSSGTVTMPYQPMFIMYTPTDASRTVSGNTATTLIPFNANNLYDPLGDYTLATGTYTIPVSGRYLLFYGTEGKTSANTNAGSIYYNINNTGINGQCLYYGEAYSGSSKQVILNLTAGDALQFQIYGNNNQSYTINAASGGAYLLG